MWVIYKTVIEQVKELSGLAKSKLSARTTICG